MKRIVVVIIFVSLCVLGWLLSNKLRVTTDTGRNNSTIAGPVATPPTGQSESSASVSVAERQRMTDASCLDYLEKLGQVPKDADTREWGLAPQTSWWGKPLDSKEFWKGRVVWLDKSAVSAAQRYGRYLPPMPYEDASIRRYPNDDDEVVTQWGVEGPNIPYRYTNREGRFWDKYGKHSPKPPENLEFEQDNAASQILGKCIAYVETHTHDVRKQMMATETSQIDESIKRHIVSLGYPVEAFSYEALFWKYVVDKRQEYADDIKRFHSTDTNAPAIKIFMGRLQVDAKYLTEPSTGEVLRKANAWKIAYIQRLRNENVDASYINAYLKAWNLTWEDVFPNIAPSISPLK